MKKTDVGIIASLLFMVLTMGAFYYSWSSENQSVSSTSSGNMYAIIDISGIKDQAETITAGKENNAGIPIAVPTTKLGKTNPFNDPE